MKKRLDNSIQVLLPKAIIAMMLENGKKESPRGSSRSFSRTKASEGLGLYDFREFSWSLLSDLLDEGGPVGASKTWPLCAG